MDRTLIRLIKNIVAEELRYFRHYDGAVVDIQDPLQKGRVRVCLKELGQTTNDQGIWARPRQLHALDVPIVGEIVEVYFINGDRTRAVYLANSSENSGQIPQVYSDPSKHVLYQDPTTGDSMVYDDKAKTFTMLMSQLVIDAGDEAFVKGSTFYTFMQSLMTWVNSHTHGSGTFNVTTAPGVVLGVSGGPTVGGPPLSDFRSTKIKGS